MVDRTPQQFPNGTPDGVTDNTAAIQAALDAWQPGDQVVLAGGIFQVSAPLIVAASDLVIRGDATVQAKSGFVGGVMLSVTGIGITIDADGLQLDQAGVIVSGTSIVTAGAVGLEVRNLVSRGTKGAFVRLESGTTDLLVHSCDHQGEGSGIVSADASGLARITLRNNRFEHPGTGTAGDGVMLRCPSFGASDVTIVDCIASGYIGEASDQGVGFGLVRATDGRLIGCTAEACENDGFRLQQEAHRWLCADLRALDVGLPAPVGANGSGLIAYDSDDITVVLMRAKNCGLHGIALSGEGKDGAVVSQRRLRGLIERCSIDTTRGDGIHVTAQEDFRIDRNLIRDPSLGNPNAYAGIHVGRQGGTALENMTGTGNGNTVVLSGATTPQGDIVVRPASVDVTIDGVTSAGPNGEPFADGTFFTDGTGWQLAA